MSSPLFDPTAAPVGRDVTVAPRPSMLDGLTGAGYELTTVAELLD